MYSASSVASRVLRMLDRVRRCGDTDEAGYGRVIFESHLQQSLGPLAVLIGDHNRDHRWSPFIREGTRLKTPGRDWLEGQEKRKESI
jgi:hypothetical protein